MTHALCGGPSESRPGFNQAIVNSAAAIGIAIEGLVPPPFSHAIAAVVASETFDLTTFCQSDPPPMPTFSPNDWLALLNPADLPNYLHTRDLIRDWWKQVFWHDACQCVSAPTPPLGPVPTPPPASSNPGLPGGDADQDCWTASSGNNVPVPIDTTSGFIDISNLLPGSTTVTVTPGHTGASNVAKVLPSGVRNITTTIGGTGTRPGPVAQLNWFGSTGTPLTPRTLWDANSSPPINPNQFTQTFVAPSGATSWNVEILPYFAGPGNVQGSPWSVSSTLAYTCGAGPNVPVVPCCPPDPSTEIRLNQMFQLLVNLQLGGSSQELTSWTDGIRHTGLRDTGRLVMSPGAVGARCEVTFVPPQTQILPGNPNFHWNLGFITPIALDVPLRGQRLVFNPQSFAFPVQADGVSWTLLNGAVMNLVELIGIP